MAAKSRKQAGKEQQMLKKEEEINKKIVDAKDYYQINLNSEDFSHSKDDRKQSQGKQVHKKIVLQTSSRNQMGSNEGTYIDDS